ncbi:MAG: endonuclease/exonuclease/phosphatase family protein [Labilithrix sp.]|nr:endonuclease/exonuclease/phosphatase family protein [Labilithrix sp.]MCW5817082.1 endonuclease/exonuclease/phosphatase family protein [Labilithrix sp.]
MTTRSFLFLALLCATGCAIDQADEDEGAPLATMPDPRAEEEEDPSAIPPSESDLTAVSTSAATGAASLRVMTYNIKHGELTGLDLAKIAAVIRESNPDILGLQEVDDGTKRSKGQRQTEELSELTNMPHAYYAPAFDYDGGKYGVAILSKYPIGAKRTVRLDGHTKSGGGFEPRVAAVADITAKGETVTFVTMHASLHEDERKATGKKLLTALGARAGRAIITGDFNEKPGADIGGALTSAGFVDAYKEKHRFFGYTAPANVPLRRIDFIYRAKGMGKTLHGWVPNTTASDHRPVGAVIPLR